MRYRKMRKAGREVSEIGFGPTGVQCHVEALGEGSVEVRLT